VFDVYSQDGVAAPLPWLQQGTLSDTGINNNAGTLVDVRMDQIVEEFADEIGGKYRGLFFITIEVISVDSIQICMISRRWGSTASKRKRLTIFSFGTITAKTQTSWLGN
jgi:hypothetical protein